MHATFSDPGEISAPREFGASMPPSTKGDGVGSHD
jgi:hypothetical protein